MYSKMADSKYSEEPKSIISDDENLITDLDQPWIPEPQTLNHEQPEGKISFEGLPYGFACSLFEKLNYGTAAIFEECSETARKFSTRRVSSLFPFRVWEVSIEGSVVGLREWDKKRNIFTLKDFPSICVISPNLKISMYKLKRHALDISATGNHFSRDFSDIEDEVSLVNTRALPLDAYFALKTKTSAKFIDSSISSKDLLFEIQKWTKGKQWSSPEIVLQNIHNFDIFDFFEAMCEKSPVEDPVPYLEWTLLREKSNEYPVLVVRMSTFERSVTMKQCRKIFMQNW